jgi:hypothetical protein
MTCPVCHSPSTRRSRRRSVLDYAFSVAGIMPWRCEACESRFHARGRPFRQLRFAHCSVCGNLDLRPVSTDRITGWFSFTGKLLRIPAVRCEPCRKNFFSVRPVLREEGEIATPGDTVKSSSEKILQS